MTDDTHDVPLPPAVEAGEFNDDRVPSRTICGPDRRVARVDVFTIGCQYVDGRIHNAGVRMESDPNDAMNSGQARQLAAELLDAADEADGWTAV
jgi:hypothetical protein